MKKFLLNLSIGLRLKITVSILVSFIIVILGFVLYDYQKGIIFEQAKQNSYATIDDLIRFTQNEIDASSDKIGYFENVAKYYLKSLGTYKQSEDEMITYTGRIESTGQDTVINVPASYIGEKRLQSDSTMLPELKEMGVDFFIYYQKVDDVFVEIINSEKQWNLANFETTVVLKSNTEGDWRLSHDEEVEYTRSYWTSNRWVKVNRSFTKDENDQINGAIIVGILERNETKLRQTFLEKKFYKTGICYQVNDGGYLSSHPLLPDSDMSDDSVVKQIIAEKMIDKASFVASKDSAGISKYYFYKYYPPTYNNIVVEIPEDEIFSSLYALRHGIFIAILIIVLCIYLLITYIANGMTNRLAKAVKVLEQLALGNTLNANNLLLDRNDEIGQIATSVNTLKQNLGKISEFANAIGQGKLETKFVPLSNDDELGNSLIGMQNSLVRAQEDERLAKLEEEKKRWASNGLAKFSDIIRLSDANIKNLAYNILKNMVDYLDVSMGALYVVEEDNNQKVLVPQAAVAYERKKIIGKKILIGEGLVGRCAFEKLSIYLTDIPDHYITIRSGLGDANPGYLLLVPLLSNNEVLGVIELASFNELEKYKQEFIEKLADNIGSTLKSTQINQRTIELLEQSKVQSEELAAQEEEMRQNMEELQSTQEEAHRRETEMMGVIDSIEKSVFKVEYNLNGNITDINAIYAQFLAVDIDILLQKKMADEFAILGVTGSTYESIMRNCSKGQDHTHVIPVNVNGKKHTIKEHYTSVGFSDDKQVKRIIKISYLIS